MKILLVFILQFSFVLAGYSQLYSIVQSSSNYDTLQTFNSVNLELGFAGEDPYSWEKSFSFGFEFPFFGESQDSVILDNDAVGYFPNSEEFNLFFFAGGYTIGDIIDTTYLDSEVRYAHSITNGLNTLIVEYHNVYVEDELDEYGTNHSINFQIWFLENGIMELHFGSIDLYNCSYYFPGQGLSSDNDDPSGEIYGPWVSINTDDFDEGACFAGDHGSPSIILDDDDNCDVLTSIPPEGFTIQFIPSSVTSTQEIKSEENYNYSIAQQDGSIRIVGPLEHYKSCTVYNLHGNEIAYSKEPYFDLKFDVTHLYILLVEDVFGTETHKITVGNR